MVIYKTDIVNNYIKHILKFLRTPMFEKSRDY